MPRSVFQSEALLGRLYSTVSIGQDAEATAPGERGRLNRIAQALIKGRADRIAGVVATPLRATARGRRRRRADHRAGRRSNCAAGERAPRRGERERKGVAIHGGLPRIWRGRFLAHSRDHNWRPAPRFLLPAARHDRGARIIFTKIRSRGTLPRSPSDARVGREPPGGKGKGKGFFARRGSA